MAQVEFRDGWREIPDYLRDLMLGLETHHFSYEEAMALANRKILEDHMSDAQAKLIKQHFRGRS